MNAKLQEQLDKQIASKRTAQVVAASEAPSFTPDIFDHDNRETQLVEVNFRDMSARVVASSDAPKITREVLEVLGKPIKTVEFFYVDSFFQASVRDGVPTELEIQQLKMILEYGDREDKAVAEKERDLEVNRLMLSKMLVDPAFSYQGVGEGVPIEARSEVMLNALAAAVSVVNAPEDDMIYQVSVLRGLPEDKFTLFGDFEWYAVGGAQKSYVDMSDEELSAEMAQNRARRQILIPAMIVDPKLTWTQVADGEVAEPIEPPKDADAPYPVELLSERFLQTFQNAHKVVTTPDAGLRSLQQYFRSLQDAEGTTEAGESVGDEQGDGDVSSG